MTKILLLVVICSLLSACAVREQFRSRGPLSIPEALEDPTKACNLYVIRSSSILGAAIRYIVALDLQDLAVMTIGDSIHVKVSPGPHIITAKYPRQMFLGIAESTFDINCDLNEPIYVYMSAGISVGFKLLSAEQGAEKVRDSDPIAF